MSHVIVPFLEPVQEGLPTIVLNAVSSLLTLFRSEIPAPN